MLATNNYVVFAGDPRRIQTFDRCIRSAMLYSLSYRANFTLYYGRESNPHEHYCSRDFKSLMSTNSITIASFFHYWYPSCQRTLLSLFYFVNIRNKFRNSKSNFIYFLSLYDESKYFFFNFILLSVSGWLFKYKSS